MLTIPQAIIDHIKAGKDFCHLIALDLAPAPIYLTDAGFNVTYNGNTYLGNGILTNLDAIVLRSEITVNQTKINFTAVEQAMVSTLLNYNQINRTGRVSRAYLNDDGGVLGVIGLTTLQVNSAPDIDESPDTAEVSLPIAGMFADFDRINNRRSTLASQQKHFPNCTGHLFASEAGKEYMWGRK